MLVRVKDARTVISRGERNEMRKTLILLIVLGAVALAAYLLLWYDADSALEDLKSHDEERVARGARYFDAHPEECTPEVREALVEVLAATPQTSRPNFNLLNALGDCKEARATPILLEMFRTDPRNRDLAITLGEIGDPTAVEPLLRMFTGPLYDRYDRQNILIALGGIGDRRALPPLLAEVEECRRRGEDFGWLSKGIAKLADERALSVLLEMSRDKDVVVRWNAAEGLGRTRTKEGLARLREMCAQEEDSTTYCCLVTGVGIDGREEAVKLLAAELDRFAELEQQPRGTQGARTMDAHYRLLQALAATQRASALAAIAENLKRRQRTPVLGLLKRYPGYGHYYIWAEVRAMMRLTGNQRAFDRIPNPESRESDERRAATYEQLIAEQLNWWDENKEWVEKLAAEGKKLPDAMEPEDLFQ